MRETGETLEIAEPRMLFEMRVDCDGVPELDLRGSVVAFTEILLTAVKVFESASARIRGTRGQKQNSHRDQTQFCDRYEFHNP